jgi:hypothetical protein
MAASAGFFSLSSVSATAAGGSSTGMAGDNGGGLSLLASREDRRSWLRFGVAGMNAPTAGVRGGLPGGVTSVAVDAAFTGRSSGAKLGNSAPGAGAEPDRVVPSIAAYDGRRGPLPADWTDGAGAGAGTLGPACTLREIAGPVVDALPAAATGGMSVFVAESSGVGPAPLVPIPGERLQTWVSG